MPLVNTKEMLKKAYEQQYAVGCFNVDSLAMVQAVLIAAENKRSPVILSFSAGSREFMHPGNIKELVEIAAKDIAIPYAIHLDHGKSVQLCRDCIDEGFTSVMIDASDKTFEENVSITKEVCAYAHARGVSVEGELGGLDADLEGESYTSALQLKEYVMRTGVDSVAVSVGTGHGIQKFKKGQMPELKWDILDQIATLLPGFPLVIHGSSCLEQEDVSLFNKFGGNLQGTIGVPAHLLKQVSQTNVCKINVGTDFRVAYVGALRKSLTENPARFEPRIFLEPARKKAQLLVEHKMSQVFMSANRENSN